MKMIDGKSINQELSSIPEMEMKKQIVVDVGGVLITVNHYYNGTKNIREIYEDFLERKLQNP